MHLMVIVCPTELEVQLVTQPSQLKFLKENPCLVIWETKIKQF